MDEVERELNIMCPHHPAHRLGKSFWGVITSAGRRDSPASERSAHTIQGEAGGQGLNNPELDAAIGDDLGGPAGGELELVQGASRVRSRCLIAGEMTPVFFWTAS